MLDVRDLLLIAVAAPLIVAYFVLAFHVFLTFGEDDRFQPVAAWLRKIYDRANAVKQLRSQNEGRRDAHVS